VAHADMLAEIRSEPCCCPQILQAKSFLTTVVCKLWCAQRTPRALYASWFFFLKHHNITAHIMLWCSAEFGFCNSDS